MWAWLKKLLGMGEKEKGRVKDFEEETTNFRSKRYERKGQQPIDTKKIVGSVGRAHELDDTFHYRERARTGRFQRIQDAMREGKPMEPIKVLRVKRDRRDSQYFVLDGHHRVAQAKEDGFDQMNADVTDVIPEDNDADVTPTDDNATE
jgi:ParB-like nuclease domain